MGSPKPDEEAIAICAHLLQSTADNLETVRLRVLAHVAFLVGSPTDHITKDKGMTEPMHPCEACNKLRTTLWILPPIIQKGTTIKPLESVALLNGVILIDEEKAEIATLGDSPHARKCRAELRTFRVKTPIHACFLCAIPTIVEIRKETLDESSETEEEILLREVRAIAQGTKLTLKFTHDFKERNKTPWGGPAEQSLINQFLENEDSSKGFVVTVAPSRIHAHQNVCFVIRVNERASGEFDMSELMAPPTQTSLDQCYELSRAMTKEGINRLHLRMNPTPSPAESTRPMQDPKQKSAETKQKKLTLWLGFNMSTFPPRNIIALKPSQMPNRSWAFIPFLWEIAGLQRHPTWTFNASELPPNWPTWVIQYKEYFESKHIDIRNQL